MNCSVLELPFKNNSLDFVLSNGVIHHTENPEKAISEFSRVLKKGGALGLAVYSKDMSLKWNVLFHLRPVVKLIPKRFSLFVLNKIFKSKRRVFLLMDFLYVPILERYNKIELNEMLERNGFEWKGVTGYKNMIRLVAVKK